MALTSVATFTTTENPPSGFQASGANGIKAAGSIGVADSTASAASMSYSTQLNADQEAQITLIYTSRVQAAVYAGLQTVNDFTSNHYRVETTTVDGNFDGIKIVKRLGGSESTLSSKSLNRGQYVSGSTIRIRKIDAGSVTIVEAWKDGYRMLSVVDASSPIQGAGYVGAWIAANSSGMGIDDFLAGNLSVYWVANSSKTNPVQSAGTNDTATNIGGSGLNRGSFTYPFQTINYGGHKSRMTATGAVLIIRGGNYSERLNDAFSDILWKTGTSWNNPTTMQNFPGEVFTVNPNGQATQVSIGQISNGYGGTQYLQLLGWRIDGLDITDGCLAFRGKNKYLRIQYSDITQAKLSNVYFSQEATGDDVGPNHFEFLDNACHDSFDSHGFYDQVTGSTIEGNDFYNNDAQNAGGNGNGYGFQHNTIAVPALNKVKSSGLIVRYNKIHGNGNGLVIEGTDNALIYGNLVYLNGSGLTTNGNTQGSPYPVSVVNGTMFFNNTVYKNNQWDPFGRSQYGMQDSPAALNTIAINNLLYANQHGLLGINMPNATLANNFNGTKDAPSEQDPLFTSVTAGSEDFHISASSPARGYGQDLSAYFSHDYYGLPITAWDAGAVQYESPVSGVAPQNIILNAFTTVKNTEGLLYLDVIDQVNSPLVKVRIKLGSQAIFTSIDTSGGVTVQ